MSVDYSNQVQYMSHAAHGHPNTFQGARGTRSLALELDVEKRLQACVAKDGIRIREFFLDFDKLRKGTCGDAAVSNFPFEQHRCVLCGPKSANSFLELKIYIDSPLLIL